MREELGFWKVLKSFKTTTVELSEPHVHVAAKINIAFLIGSFFFPFSPSFPLAYFYLLPNKQLAFMSHISVSWHMKHSKPKQLSTLKFKYSQDQNVKQSFIETWNYIWKKNSFWDLCIPNHGDSCIVIITSLLLKLFCSPSHSFNSYLDNIPICKVISRNLDLC